MVTSLGSGRLEVIELCPTDEGAEKRILSQAIERLEAELREREAREQAEEAEERRVEEDAESVRRTLLDERVDEKESLGLEILGKLRQLREDPLIRKYRGFMGEDWDGFVPIHERLITNVAELRPDMPVDRAVTEVFQLSDRGVLYYNQFYEAKHFAEGMLQFHIRKDPIRYGVKLGKPSDFRALSFASVKAFTDALSEGEPYRVAAERITRQVEAEREAR